MSISLQRVTFKFQSMSDSGTFWYWRLDPSEILYKSTSISASPPSLFTELNTPLTPAPAPAPGLKFFMYFCL